MKFQAEAGPHWHSGTTVVTMMRKVIAALVPILVISVWLFGPSVLINVSSAICLCLALEWVSLKLRGRPIGMYIRDGSAVVTAILLALALPPMAPWWVIATASLFAIVIAKHLYGGLGYNVFNPAMVGYVVVLIAFPQHLASWPTIDGTASWPPLPVAFDSFLFGNLASLQTADAYTSATPLDTVKIQLNQMRTMQEIFQLPGFGSVAGTGWIWLNLAALAGGLWLIQQRVIRWHIPVAMLSAIVIVALGFYALDTATHPSPLFELLSGGTMLGAFFVATDPVSAAASDRGKLIYGAGIGVLCILLRRWGSNPDGIAFAVLLMNMAVPLLDRLTLPRVYGHRQKP